MSNKQMKIQKYPHFLVDIEEMLEDQDYRIIDREAQKTNDVILLQYLTTLLCDELIKLSALDKDEL